MLDRVASTWRFSSWERLRRLGRSPVFTSIIFFPLVTAVIGMNRTLISVPLLGVHFSLEPWYAFKLHLFYFGLAFLFGGSAFFAYQCPEFIKRYENSLE